MINKNYHINQDEISHYLKDVRGKKVLTPEREKDLAKIILKGNPSKTQIDEIQNELMEGNLRFVISVAKKYQNQGLDLADLIAEGNYGLIKAIKNFDWARGYRFISYAVWWIKQSILQSLNENARTIRLPANIVQELQKARRKVASYTEEDEGKQEELSTKLATLPKTVFYNKPINEDGDTLLDLIPNDESESPDKCMDDEDSLKTELNVIMSILDEREKIIVMDYYGLSGIPRTLSEIGEDFSLTKERVRQIKEKALRKLRNESQNLLDYLLL